MIGSIVSHYRIVEKLGEGGMGVVYRARDTKLDRDVALKFLPDELTSSAVDLARFEREARTIAALNHPHIESIHGFDEAAGKKFLVLEYIPCGTLKIVELAEIAVGSVSDVREGVPGEGRLVVAVNRPADARPCECGEDTSRSEDLRGVVEMALRCCGPDEGAIR